MNNDPDIILSDLIGIFSSTLDEAEEDNHAESQRENLSLYDLPCLKFVDTNLIQKELCQFQDAYESELSFLSGYEFTAEDHLALFATYSRMVATFCEGMSTTGDSDWLQSFSFSDLELPDSDVESVSEAESGLKVVNSNKKRFSDHITDLLRKVFEVKTHVNAKEVYLLSERTGLTPSQIQTWFSNRRAQPKRTHGNSEVDNVGHGLQGSKAKRFKRSNGDTS